MSMLELQRGSSEARTFQRFLREVGGTVGNDLDMENRDSHTVTTKKTAKRRKSHRVEPRRKASSMMAAIWQLQTAAFPKQSHTSGIPQLLRPQQWSDCGYQWFQRDWFLTVETTSHPWKWWHITAILPGITNVNEKCGQGPINGTTGHLPCSPLR